MQTIRLRLEQPMKDATLVNEFAQLPELIARRFEETRKVQKLTETRLATDATSPPLLSEELKKFCSSLEQRVTGLNAKYRETLDQFQELSIRLAVEIATAVVGYEVAHHETRIRRLLETLISQHESPTPQVVYVHKQDLERLRISLRDTPSLDSMLQLKVDDGLTPGDVRVESSEQRLIASCQQQLTSIQKQLMEYLANARLEPTES